MGPVDATRTCLRKYFTFSGRARRPEYWWFVAVVTLCSALAAAMDAALFGPAETSTGPADAGVTQAVYGGGPINSILSLLVLAPLLAAGWRRMHDTGRPGIYLLYPLLVMIGLSTFLGLFTGGGDSPEIGTMVGIVAIIALIVLALSPFIVIWWLTRPSEPGPNAYGPGPSLVPAGANPWAR